MNTSNHVTRLHLAGSCSKIALAVSAGAGLVLAPVPALAAGSVTNSATATGTYNATPFTSDPDTVNVPIADPAPSLLVSKTGVINDGGDGIDAGDTITYTVTVENNGDVTLTSVTPSEDGITFNLVAGTGTFGSFSPAPVTLAPGASQDFTIVYTLSQADIYNAAGVTDGVVNTASADATSPSGPYSGPSDTGEVTIPAEPALTVAKSFVISTDNGAPGEANVGDIITYTYTVTNTGNVPLTGITIADVHEPGGAGELNLSSTTATSTTTGPWGETELTADALGLNDDTSGVNGSWDTLGPEGQVTFTYVHTVTQAEFDDQ